MPSAPDIPLDVFTLARQEALPTGPVPCDFMFIGEAPGQMEDWHGSTLIGPTGQLFNKLLEWFTVLRRPDVYATNVVKHWPGPGNPTPKVGQIKPYLPRLYWEIEQVQPKVIVCLGAVAIKVFDKTCRLKQDHGLARECTIPNVWSGIMIPWYHPAYAIRFNSMMPTIMRDAERLRETIENIKRTIPPGDYNLWSAEQAADMCLERWGEYGFDTETTAPTRSGVFCTDEARMVGFSVSGARSTGIYVPDTHVGTGMAAILESPLWTKVCWNAKFELKVLANLDPPVHMDGWEDGKIAAYLLGHERTGLKEMAKQLLDKRPVHIKELWPDGIADQPLELTLERYRDNFEYGAADSDNTISMWPELRQRLHDEGLWLVYEMEKRLTPVLVSMEKIGMNVDVEQCRKVSTTLHANEARVRSEVFHRLAKLGVDVTRLNLNSPDQLEKVLVELGAPLTDLTDSKSRFKVDAPALHRLKDKGWHPEVIEPLLDMRKYGDLREFVDRFEVLRGPDGRLHTSFNQSGHWEEGGAIDPKSSPATGRLSSSGPNLMNIPHHRAKVEEVDWAVPIRSCLVPTEGWRIMSVDLGQEEPRIVAITAGDETLLNGFANGYDIYHQATSALYPYIASDMPDKEFRERCARGQEWEHERFVGKTFFLAWYYGAGAGRLLTLDPVLKKSAVNQAVAAISLAHPARDAYLADTARQLEAQGFVTSLFGRRRRITKYWSPVRKTKEEALREAANDRIQATAADILKTAMPDIHNKLGDAGLKARLISTVHDEVVLEMPPSEIGLAHAIVARAFRDLLPGLPLEVEAGVGLDWGHLKGI
jgi:uracil-DNA glycosylase family 4